MSQPGLASDAVAAALCRLRVSERRGLRYTGVEERGITRESQPG
ncbi:MAG: hypothetical protein WB783_20460 [Arenicellales bacterium]